MGQLLANFDANARNGFAREVRLFGLDESDSAVFRGVNREVARHVSARACEFSRAGLADEDFASLNFLPAKALDTKTLTGVVMDVLSGSTRFDM